MSVSQLSPWQGLLDELALARDHHASLWADDIRLFVTDVENRYLMETDRFISGCNRDPLLAELMAPTLVSVAGYLSWAKWICWSAANLSPLVADKATAAERLSVSMLSYVGGRLIDDGLDGHLDYRGQRMSVVGELMRLRPEAPPNLSCGLSVYWGCLLVRQSFERLRQLGQSETLGQLESLFNTLTVGFLAEAAVSGSISSVVYMRVATRKSAGYDLMLYKPVVQDLEPLTRAQLLSLLGRMSVLSQIVNDFHDLEEDRARGQMNAFLIGVCNPEEARREVLQRAQALWDDSRKLPEPETSVIASMIANLHLENLREAVE